MSTFFENTISGLSEASLPRKIELDKDYHPDYTTAATKIAKALGVQVDWDSHHGSDIYHFEVADNVATDDKAANKAAKKAAKHFEKLAQALYKAGTPGSAPAKYGTDTAKASSGWTHTSHYVEINNQDIIT